jgi:hypothetical protein
MIPYAKVENAFDEFIQSNGADCEFRLRTGEVFVIRGAARFQAEQGMTEGLQQDRRRLSVMEARWRAAAPTGRDPEKGDQVTVSGTRFAIQEADPAIVQNRVIGWRIKLKG